MSTGLGIDVGHEYIKVVRASVSGGKVTVTGALKISRKASGAVDADAASPEETAGDDGPRKFGKRPAGATPAAISAPLAIPPNLGALLKAAKLSATGTVGITGREVNLKYMQVPPVPPDKLRMLLGIELGGKYGNIKTADDDGPAITYDWKILDIPGGLKSDLLVLAGTVKTEYLLNIYKQMSDAGVSVTDITPSAFGLVQAFLATQAPPPGETVVLCDVGHELLEIAIIEDKCIYFARSGPGGGKKFNQSLDKILQTGPDRAAVFKHERARLYPEGAEMRSKQDENFQPALREGADAIATAIRSSIMFARTQAKLPNLDFKRVYLSGGGARIKGLCDYLEKKMARPVQPLNLSVGVNFSKLDPATAQLFEGSISDMSVALGLAVIDANPKVFHFRFVPEMILARRAFWRKTVLGAVAGVLLIASLAMPYVWSKRSAEESEKVISKFDDLKAAAVNERKKYRKNVEEKKVFAATVDYYARQTRIGRVYVDLFKAIRVATPPNVMLNYVGPAGAGDDSGGASGAASAGPGLGSWSGVEEPVREIVIKGIYDKDAYPETPSPTINQAWLQMRDKLLKVPGVIRAELMPLADLDPLLVPKLEKAGKKPFQAKLKIQDYTQPLKLAETAEAKP